MAGGVALGVAGLAAAVVRWRAPHPPGPNVVIVLWDTVRADRTTISDPALATTPRLAAWAARQGLVYENAVSPGMWTVPSHASMFTGSWPATHGASLDHRWLDARNVTLAEHLRDHGWQTYAFSANPNLSPTRVNLLQGFTDVDLAWDPRWKGRVMAYTNRKLIERDRSTEISPSAPDRRPVGTYNAAPATLAGFRQFLDRRDPDKPFLAYLSFMEAHKPRVPSAESRLALLDDETIELGLATDLTSRTQLLYGYGEVAFTADELAAVRGVYDAAIRDLDDPTADLLEMLARRGLAEDTLVIFTADHGEQLGDHEQFGHRKGVYQSLVHVPLVLSWPGHIEPGRVSTPVSTRDLYATVLAATGLAAPVGAQAIQPADLTGPPAGGPVFSESTAADRVGHFRVVRKLPHLADEPWAQIHRAIVDDGWKLIETIDLITGGVTSQELYDLRADPDELHDRADAEPGRVAALGTTLHAWESDRPHWDAVGADPVENEEDDDEGDDDDLRQTLEVLGYATE